MTDNLLHLKQRNSMLGEEFESSRPLRTRDFKSVPLPIEGAKDYRSRGTPRPAQATNSSPSVTKNDTTHFGAAVSGGDV